MLSYDNDCVAACKGNGCVTGREEHLREEPGRARKGEPRAPSVRRRTLSIDEYAAGIEAGERSVLARAISLIESNSARHAAQGQELLTRLMPKTGGATRVGITGVPGAGKSTFIERLGSELTANGRRVAVLAVDPSSGVTGGSILGDKTRMPKLSADPNAFIRPSPSGGALGGVGRKTRETMLLCEAAGFDVVFVETVGVGQSEAIVAGMTDVFLAILIAGAGDELQGIKRGLLELVDIVAINKADGEGKTRAERAARMHAGAFHLMAGGEVGREPDVLTCSALTGEGIAEVWEGVRGRLGELRATGELDDKRRRQAVGWMRALVDEKLRSMLEASEEAAAARAELERAVAAGEVPPTLGAERLVESFLFSLRDRT